MGYTKKMKMLMEMQPEDFLIDSFSMQSYDRRMNIEYGEDSITYQFICPGRKKENLSVKIKGDSLWITIPENRPYRLQINTKKYDIESTSAKYEDGILYISLNEVAQFEQVIKID